MRKSTCDYVREQLKSVPNAIMVVVIVNFKDLVTQDPSACQVEGSQIRSIISENIGREIVVFECCLKDNYGLKTLYNYINLPFLMTKMRALQEQLDRVNRNSMHRRTKLTCMSRRAIMKRMYRPSGLREHVPV